MDRALIILLAIFGLSYNVAAQEEKTITLSFPDGDLNVEAFVEFVRSNLDLPLVYDKTLFIGDKSKLAIKTSGENKVSRNELLFLLNNTLRIKGLGLARDNRVNDPFFIIKRIPELRPLVPRGRAADFETGAIFTEIFEISNGTSAAAQKYIQSFFTDGEASPIYMTDLADRNSVIVTGFKRDMVSIEEIVARINGTASKLSRKFYPAKNIPLEELETLLSSALGRSIDSSAAQDSNNANKQENRLRILKQESRNRLMLIGSERQLAQALSILGEIDIPSGMKTELYSPLQISAQRLDEFAQALVPSGLLKRGYRSTIDESKNMLIVQASDEIQRQIKDLVEKLDKSGDGRPTPQRKGLVQTYELKNVKAQDILDTIRAVERTTFGNQYQRNRGQGSLNFREPGVNNIQTLPNSTPFNPGFNTPFGLNLRLQESLGDGFLGGQSQEESIGQRNAFNTQQNPESASNSIIPGEAQVESFGNKIIVVAEPQVQALYAELIDQLDKRPPQVLIEATVVSIDYSDDYALGIEISGGDRITDSFGNVYTFTFGSDIAGRETVSSIELPNGEDVSFTYTSDNLTEVSTNNWEWSASVSVNSTTQTVDYLVTDPVQGEREYHLTQDYFLLDDELLNQPANVCRSIYSGTRNIISFFPNPSDYTEVRVLRGTDQLSVCQYGQSEKFASSFTIGDIDDGYDAFTSITWESGYQYKDYGFSPSYDDQDYRLGAAETMVGSDGYSVDYTYDSDFYVTEATYDDSTTEEFSYDSNKNLTRQKDRLDRVVKYVYDSQNNMTEKKIGILEVSGSDVNQSEYAVYEFDYYASSHANEFLLKTEYDPRHTSETDLYRTDYEYDSNDRMTKKTESADVASGTRPEWTYAYNSNGQLSSSDDPLDRTTTFIYNDSGQMTQATYEDGSTDQYFYDSTADLSGRVKYFKDRGDVVRYTEYNDDGKVAKVTSNYGTDTNVLDGAVASVETDATQKSISINAFDSVSGLLDYSLSDGDRAEYTYDYRRRTTQTRRYVASGVYRDAKTVYDSDHRVFYTEDHWGRRSYNGYRTSDGAKVRTIQCAHDGITYANNSAVMAATRVDGLNDTSIIADAILNDAGEVTDIYDARGIQTTVVFNSRGQVTIRTEAVGETVERKTETDYDVAGNAIEVRHPRYFDSGDTNGYQKCKTVNTYNGRGLLVSSVAASGSPVAATTSYTYHLDGKQATRTDPRGKIWSTDYHNCCGRFLGSENPLGHGTLSNTDYLGRVTHSITVEDYDDHTSNSHNPVDAKTMGERTVRYDGLGRTIASTNWLVARGTVDENDPPIAGFDSVSASDGLTSQVIYDSNLADGVGLDNTTGVTVDKMGGGTFNVSLSDCLTQLAETFANGGGNLSFTNNYATGSATVSISPEYNISVSIQDGSGQVVMTAMIESFNGSNPNDLITWSCSRANYSEVSEGGFGNVVTSYSIDALGNTASLRIDGVGRAIVSSDPSGNVSSLKFDANGNVVETGDANEVGIAVVYDELGRVVLRTDTYGDGTSYSYDENGNQLTVTDAKSEVATYLYDALNRKIKTTDRLGGETEYTFDLNGNMTSTTDAENKVTEYEFDDAGRKIKETYPDHVGGTSAGDQHYGIIEFAFDPAGRLQQRTDQKGDTCTLNYDLVGRLTSKDYRLRVNSPAGTIADTDSFTFDAASRMLTAVSGRYSNTVTKTYDGSGRLEDESLTIGSGMIEKTYTVNREYDNRGQLWKLTYPDTTVVERTYTDRGLLHTVKYGATTIDTRTYDSGGRLSTSTYGNGVVTTYEYRNTSGDKDNQIDSINIVKSATTIDAFDYTYDANKNVITETRTGVMSNFGWTTDNSGSSGFDGDDRLTYWERDDSNLTQEWSLSIVGDWNSITENTVATTHTYNDIHELTAVGGSSLSYDANGNLTTNDNGDDYSWDFDNRMTGADTDAVAGNDVTFEYDALGRRVRKDNGSDDVVYVHAGQQLVAEYDFGTAASSPTEQYAYGSYIDEPIIKDGTLLSGTGIVYYHHDRRFSVVALTNTSGSAVERYAYSPYGAMSAFSGNGTLIGGTSYANTTTFTGRRWDDDTELFYFRARYFDSSNGRFVGRDPLNYVDGMSLYRGYFSPLGVDPFGLCLASYCNVWVQYVVGAEVNIYVSNHAKKSTVYPGSGLSVDWGDFLSDALKAWLKARKRGFIKFLKSKVGTQDKLMHVNKITVHASIDVEFRYRCIVDNKVVFSSAVESALDDSGDGTEGVLLAASELGGLGVSPFKSDGKGGYVVDESFFKEVKKVVRNEMTEINVKEKSDLIRTRAIAAAGDEILEEEDCCTDPKFVDVQDVTKTGFSWTKW